MTTATPENGHPPAGSGAGAVAPVRIVIRPARGLGALRLGELWEYRELLGFLVWRDVLVRFKQAAFGIGWAVLQPLLLTAVLTIFLNRVAGVYSYGVPYAVFALAGIVPWMLFSRALLTSSGSLVENANLVSKVYFPRLALPIAAASSYLIDFAVSLVVLLAVMFIYGVALTWAVLLMPVFALFALLVSLSFGIWFSAVNVRYRDVSFLLPFAIQLGLLVTPIAYSSSRIPEQWQPYVGLNPMAGVVEGFRWSVTGIEPPSLHEVGLSLGVTLVVLVLGLVYFRKTERTFADVI
jgi:lipopolysaccharide transport system permease protein